jgi:hypothetical protein
MQYMYKKQIENKIENLISNQPKLTRQTGEPGHGLH